MAADRPGRRSHLDPEVLQKIASLELVAREVVEGSRVGIHRSPLRGFSTEFAHHRPYVPGDPAKHVDWCLYGRTRRYYVKLFEAETNFEAYLLLDASASMRFASGSVSKLDYSRFLAASLAYLIVAQRDSAGLGIFDDRVRSSIDPSSSMRVIHDIDVELGKVTRPRPGTDIASVLHEFAARLKRRSVVVLFSDLFDREEDVIRGLDHLRFRGHNVIVFHVLDPHELTFPLKGSLRFEDLEGEAVIPASPQRIRESYLAELEKFTGALRAGCEKNHSDYVLVDTSRPLDEVLSAYLAQRVSSGAGTRNR
jgi:uncharacterized protein (DUF58 family)